MQTGYTCLHRGRDCCEVFGGSATGVGGDSTINRGGVLVTSVGNCIGVGCCSGEGASSGSTRVGLDGCTGVRSCSKLESVCNFVDWSPCRIALRWPLWVARSDGGYLFNCLTVKAGNVVR